MTLNLLKKLLIPSIILLFCNYCYAQKSPAKDPTIKIAIAAPFTGPYASYGKQLLLASSQAITDLNAKQNSTNNLEIIPFDDQCNPDLAKSIAIKITSDPKIRAVIGHTCSAATMATSKIYTKYGILNITPTSTNPKITELGISTLFRMCGKDDIQAQHISNFLANKWNNKKIAILHSQDLYSKELAEYVQENLAILNISPTVYQSITIDHLNNHAKLKVIIKKLKKLKIDIVFFSGLYKETANLIKSIHHSKIKISFIASDSIATPGFIEALGSSKIATGTIMSFQKLDPADLKLENKIEGQALFGYSAIQVINAAIENNTSTNGRILAHWLHQNKVNTILGEKSWDTNGDVINAEFTMYIWDENGKYWPLSPSS